MTNLATLHLTRAVLPVEPTPVVSMVDSMEVALVEPDLTEPDLAAMVLAVVVSVVAVLPETVGGADQRYFPGGFNLSNT